ncbi:hypothetical protein BKA70DRAFT_371668 [Coprinopsis sp. MPI-PUGE-AT-0042]|nr:hypothetical protein BKA70DRAFT_371668 [Coprinopsis sp. MPI-PUGE-AT-0042]
MPSFLSKVLRRKRDAEKDGNSSPSSTGGELLGGRFEDVSPTVSPSIGRFPELKGNTDFRGRNQEKTTQKDHAARTLFQVQIPPTVASATDGGRGSPKASIESVYGGQGAGRTCARVVGGCYWDARGLPLLKHSVLFEHVQR